MAPYTQKVQELHFRKKKSWNVVAYAMDRAMYISWLPGLCQKAKKTNRSAKKFVTICIGLFENGREKKTRPETYAYATPRATEISFVHRPYGRGKKRY